MNTVIDKDVAYEQALDKIVNQWVFYNQTILINEVIKISDNMPNDWLINYYDIENLRIHFNKENAGDSITAEAFDKLDEEEQDNYFDESEDQEVLEWWLVDRYLADRLFEKGEPVIRTDYIGNWWGRTCCGQAISMDYVIEEIAKEIM